MYRYIYLNNSFSKMYTYEKNYSSKCNSSMNESDPTLASVFDKPQITYNDSVIVFKPQNHEQANKYLSISQYKA